MLKLIKNTFENSFETSLNVCQRLHFTRSNFWTCFTVCNVYYAPNGHQKRSRFLDGISYWTRDDEWSGRERDSGIASDLEWIWAEHLLCHSNGGKSVGFVVKSVHSHRSGFFSFRIALDVLLHFSHNKEFSVNFVVTMTIAAAAAAAVATPLLLRLLLMLHAFFVRC